MNFPLKKLFRSPRQAKRGIALIVVLAMLSLMTVLVVAIFTTAGTERLAATGAANSAQARILSDTVLNIAIGQITHGTKSYSDATDPSTRLAWASQPGMIRTYDSLGNDQALYKLYSADEMVVTAVSGNGANMLATKAMADSTGLPGNWNKGINTSAYADLNAPVMVTDPANLAIKKAVYPIMDPSAIGVVEGFNITSAPGYSGNTPSPSNNPAPMPVKWLYVLKDGTLTTGNANGTTIKVDNATVANPIVGRVAFWADDETGKVNLNTASEGTYWDVPRIYSMEDYGRYNGVVNEPGLSIAQPAQKEFQRYPGHPATTSLSPVLGSVMPISLPITMSNAAQFTPYYALVPRVGTGGSTSGTRTSSAPMTFESNRLFANFDELLFSPLPSVPATTPATRGVNTNITPALLEKAKFFLTASSNAPETTLFNTPRIAIWPINQSSAKRTIYDHLMAFCATISSRNYYFTRSNPQSGTVDYALLDNLGKPRNKELYEYLQALTSRPIPGYGGNFLSKYGAASNGVSDRDQILTYIYDYIRCTNLQDKTIVNGSTLVQPYTPIFSLDVNSQYGAGEVIPIRIGNTQGFGRFNSISEACILFYGTKSAAGKTTAMRAVFLTEYASPAQGIACMRSSLKYRVTGLENLMVDVDGTGYKSLKMPADGTNFMDNSDIKTLHGRSIGGSEAPAQGLTKQGGSGGAQDQVSKPFNDSDAGQAARNVYPFFSSTDVPIPDTVPLSPTPKFKFTAQQKEIVLEVKSATNEVVQTIHLNFPDGEFKLPTVKGGATTHNYGQRGLAWAPEHEIVSDADTIIGLQIAGTVPGGTNGRPGLDSTAGDTRMVESLIDVPASRFRVHDNYYTTSASSPVQYAHSLLLATGHPIHSASFGKLVNVSGYNNPGIYRQPDVPPCVGNAVLWKSIDGKTGPGDWDTGFADQKDGAHINKPDEGDTYIDATNKPYLLGRLFGYASATNAFFSPNRQIPSPLMFGSIPTGVQRLLPWQTLLFNPKPDDLNHSGRLSPPDHLLADLFWMPVIEPYAESQAFSTAGKINMNYQIQPFTHIRRDTGLRAVMKSTKFLALKLADSTTYKPIDPNEGSGRIANRRQFIDLPTAAGTIPETFVPFDTKFKNGEIFKSATQICEMNLVPTGARADKMADYWNDNKLSGDNIREKPYVDIYPRLTTKSNTFNVHARIQVLQKARSTDPGQWDPSKDQVVSEVRTSSIIERYITINDPSLPDFATLNLNDAAANIDQYYKFRVLNTKRFAP